MGAEASMEFRILGALEVTRDGARLSLGGAKQRALLAILLIQHGRVVSAERLTELLWRDGAPATAVHAVEVHISQLRRLLEPDGPPYQRLVTSAAGYSLRIDPAELDSNVFQALVESAKQAPPEEALSSLNQGLALWRGEVLEEFATDRFALSEISRMNELRLLAIEERIEAELALGRHDALIGELVALTHEHPLRERLCGQLMLALYRSGRQAEASDVYQRTRDKLVDELGMEPGPQLQTLLKQILQQDPTLGPDRARSTPRKLPAELTTFIGRTRELEEIAHALAQARLVTLVGVGGCGKTRLAVHTLDGPAGDFPDGAWFVGLATFSEPSMISQAIASSLGVREQPGRELLDTVIDYLRKRSALLLLDNCEHLVDGVAATVEALLSGCRGLRILATSRERLRIDGEHVYQVPPLVVPPDAPVSADGLKSFESTELFIQRARQSRPGFKVVDANARDVAELCRRLDGIPLAIELAAAQVSALTPHEIVNNLGGRFAILASGDRARHPKQRTLWATLDWSHQLLGDSEKAIFRRLAVFVGGFHLDAAKSVVPDLGTAPEIVASTLVKLIDKSLVLAEPESSGGTRYRLLETVREFASDKLDASDETDLLRDRHATHYLDFARIRHSRNWDVVQRLPEYVHEDGNLHAALAWLRSHRPHDGLQLATWLARYWEASGRLKEGISWFDSMLSAGDVVDKQLLAAAHFRAGTLAYLDGNYDVAFAQITASIELKREVGDLVGIAHRMGLLSAVTLAQGNSVRALELAEECQSLALRYADERTQAWAAMYLAWVVYLAGDSARAKQLFTDAEGPLRAAGDYQGLGFLVSGLLVIESEHQDFASARRWARDVIDVAHAHRVYLEEPGWLGVLFILAEAEGRNDSAVRLWGAVLRMESEGRSMYNLLRLKVQLVADRVKARIGDLDFDRLAAEGAAMSNDALIAEALKEPEASPA